MNQATIERFLKYEQKNQEAKAQAAPVIPVSNFFVNDGSFMEQFMRLSQTASQKQDAPPPPPPPSLPPPPPPLPSAPYPGAVKPPLPPGPPAVAKPQPAPPAPKPPVAKPKVQAFVYDDDEEDDKSKPDVSYKRPKLESTNAMKGGPPAPSAGAPGVPPVAVGGVPVSANPTALLQPPAAPLPASVPNPPFPSGFSQPPLPAQPPSMMSGYSVEPPADPELKNIIDRCAEFVVRNGQDFENVTKQRNQGNPKFRFLFDTACPEHHYYKFRVAAQRPAPPPPVAPPLPQVAPPTLPSGMKMQTWIQPGGAPAPPQYPPYHMPATAPPLMPPAPYVAAMPGPSAASTSLVGGASGGGESAADSVAKMEAIYRRMREKEGDNEARSRAAEKRGRVWDEEAGEEISVAEAADRKAKGHHIGDFIPKEELERFMSKTQGGPEFDENRIDAGNIGHKLLQKMGWKEGSGLGADGRGITAPISAGGVKIDALGVGALRPGEVGEDDDIYEQYKKRMMLGYRFRPNPLNNPRKQYY